MRRARIVFGGPVSRAVHGEDGITFTLSAPVLGGAGELSLALPEASRAHEEEGCLVHDADDLAIGFLRGASGRSLEASTRELYDRLFGIVGDRFLYRVWHFIPRINASGAGLENYRLFCRARANAFRRALGEECHTRMPAASAVGAHESEPVMLFTAGSVEPLHAENPEQVPAYLYPPVYGPKSPSFARATRATVNGGDVVFISGTASIKGSETVHPNDVEKQVAVSLHNLSLIGESSGLGSDLRRGGGASRKFVVYVRRKEDFPRIEALLRDRLLAPGDESIFLLADICRAELMVEIEATVFTAAGAVQFA